MLFAFRFFGRHVVAVQVVTIVSLFLAVALVPPARGSMILIPISSGAARGMVARAVEQGASLVGRGPLPGSFVVSGSRAALAADMLAHGVLVLAAPRAGCGDQSA